MLTRPLTRTTITLPAPLREALRTLAVLRGLPESDVLREAISDYLADPEPPALPALTRAALRLPAAERQALDDLAAALGLSLSALCTAAVERYCGSIQSSPARALVEASQKGASHVSAASRPPP